MSKRISIITAFPITIPHPRVETERKILAEAGYEVKVMSFPRHPGMVERIVNYTSLNFFKRHIYHEILKSIRDEDIIILYDFQLLPLVRRIKKRNIKVIYETIDNMVHLNYHFLARSLPFIRPAKRIILSRYSDIERKLASEAAGIIVNSKALTNYFQPVTTSLIYYCSPFESENRSVNFGSAPALLYLGLFSSDKGSRETLTLQSKLGIPLFILGDIKEKELISEVLQIPGVVWEPRQTPEMLGIRLKELRAEYRLMGVSIIQPVHYSYATQEANKDQDYLAMGIPIAGNTRMPTYEKIQAGCGVQYTEIEEIKKMAGDTEKYDKTSQMCLRYYDQNYSRQLFREKLLRLVGQVSGQTK